MKSCLFLFILLAYTFTSSFSFAQTEMSVRGYEREDHSRVVLQLQNAGTTYQIERNGGTLSLIFAGAITADLVELNIAELKNIGALIQSKESKSTLSLTIPPSSEVRDISIGRRIVLDIYSPENIEEQNALKQPPSQQESPKPEAVAETVTNTTKTTTPHSEQTRENTNVQNVTPDPAELNPLQPAPVVPEQAPPRQIVLVPQKLNTLRPSPKAQNQGEKERLQAEKEKKANIEKLSQAIDQKTHVISFRSTNSFPMAAFEHYGQLWFVVNDSKSYILPGITSPTPDIFSGFDRTESGNAVIYVTTNPDENLKIKAQGGNLVWDVILGTDIAETNPVKPRRNLIKNESFQNGKLLWPLSGIGEIIDIQDPKTGKNFKIVTVRSAIQQAGQFQSFAEFDVLTSYIGMAIYPKVDDLTVTQTPEGIEISRKGSLLSIAPQSDVTASEIFWKQQEQKKDSTRTTLDKLADAQDTKDQGIEPQKPKEENLLFKFNSWKMGAPGDVRKKENTILGGLKSKEQSARVEDLLTLGKMMLSHGRGAEALGYFDYAADELPSIEASAEFRALRGAAQAFDWKSEAALVDLLHPDLQKNDEALFWKAYTLADLGDWNQAANSLPRSYTALYSYPYEIAHRLALGLAEVNLRDGNVRQADELLGLVEEKQEQLKDHARAYLEYLRGESFRQKGETDKTREIWQDLTKNKDDLFRTKAGLALTILLAKKGEIKEEEIIDRLERLRYAWRGDELEANVNYWLGDAYFKKKNYIKGLSIMRNAAALAENEVLASRITTDMTQTFASMYLGPDLKDISALDAVAVYEEFSELTPTGPEGDRLVQMLAEHLVNSDLLGRASKLLKYQVDHRLEGKEKLRIAIRLAAIELLDKNPQEAINALIKAEDTLKRLSNSPENRMKQHEIDLLRIRAYSQNKQYNRAMQLIENLPQSANVSRLKADVAWQAGYWEEAATALNNVLAEENINEKSGLSKEQESLILNRAIALNLTGDRIGLANMRKKYSALMQATNRANQFELITRAQQSGLLADRETLMSAVSEVDMFKDFLESYRKQQ